MSLYFSHWVGIGPVSIIVVAVFLCALARKAITGRLKKEFVVIIAFIGIYASFVLLMQRPDLEEFVTRSPTKTPRLLLQALGPFLIFALLGGLLRPLAKGQLKRFLLASYYVFAITILLEWLLVNVVGVSNTLMPGFRDSPAYYTAFKVEGSVVETAYRPFGLTGSPSVNGSLLVVATWMLVFSGTIRHASSYVLAAGVILFLNNSGQALLAYLFLIAYYFLENRRGPAKFFLFVPVAALMVYVIRSGIIEKLSFDYILNMLQYTGTNAISEMDFTSRIMGGYGRYSQMFEDPEFATEFYAIYAITTSGMLIVLATWSYIFVRLPRPRRVPLFLLLLFVSSHYPTILFVELQVLLGGYMLWTPRDHILKRAKAGSVREVALEAR